MRFTTLLFLVTGFILAWYVVISPIVNQGLSTVSSAALNCSTVSNNNTTVSTNSQCNGFNVIVAGNLFGVLTSFIASGFPWILGGLVFVMFLYFMIGSYDDDGDIGIHLPSWERKKKQEPEPEDEEEPEETKKEEEPEPHVDFG